MASILPTIPRIVFTIFEPLSLVAGFLGPIILSPEKFISDQTLYAKPETLTKGSEMVAYQLGNIYLLLGMIGVAVLYTTTEVKVVRNYIFALWLADITHVGITAWVMGYDQVIDVAHWNSMAWGNIGVTAALFAFRSAYFLGFLGKDRIPAVEKKAQ